MSDEEVAEMIEGHIDFYDEKDGPRRSVHLPMSFVRHYRQRHDDVLPTVVAIATSPIVLADGGLLAPDGLDRDRGIVFYIPEKLREVVPEPENCTKEAARKAMQFLTEEWLCDVASDYVGKCTLIAAAMTVLERSLLPDRPAFFVTAGRRGGGKTTTIIMLLMAVTGLRPAASSWSTNEEERRKALLAQFMCGVPYVLWDNIARATQISCPHIERSCTSAYYSDRRLGVSEMVSTAASAIHFFSPATTSPHAATSPRAPWMSASMSTAPIPRTGNSSIPIRSDGRTTTAPKFSLHSIPSCLAIPGSTMRAMPRQKHGSKCGGG
jgi:hypothetical protein